MPYYVKQVGNEHCVFKKADNKRMGCHPSPDKAKAQMRALYAAEGAELPADIHTTVQEQLGAVEAVWSENAEGLPQADVVIIRPGESLNRRFYPKEVIAEAVKGGFWDNTPMFLNHGDRAMPRKRNLEHLKARIEAGSTYVGSEGEARGRVTFIDPAFATFVKNAGKSAGLSAVMEFMGTRRRGNDGHHHEQVNKLVENISVDFVAFPAAGGEIAQFLPAQESEDEMTDWAKVSPEMVKENAPETYAQILAMAAETDTGSDDGGASDDTGDDTEKPDEQPKPEEGKRRKAAESAPSGYVSLATVRSIVQEQVDKIHDSYAKRDSQIAETRKQNEAHVAKSGLPEKTKARLLSAVEGDTEYDKDAMQLAIEDAAEELKETGWRGPRVLGLGDSTAEESADDGKGQSREELEAAGFSFMAVEQQLAFKPRNPKSKVAQEGREN